MPLIVEVANAENTSGPHNEGRPPAAPPKMGAAAFGRRPHFGNSLCGPLVFSALATSTIKGIGHFYY